MQALRDYSYARKNVSEELNLIWNNKTMDLRPLDLDLLVVMPSLHLVLKGSTWVWRLPGTFHASTGPVRNNWRSGPRNKIWLIRYTKSLLQDSNNRENLKRVLDLG